jgi:predicted permease
LLGSVLIPASAPPATNTAIFAAKYERDTGLASQIVSVVSIISIITMPVMIALSQTAW